MTPTRIAIMFILLTTVLAGCESIDDPEPPQPQCTTAEDCISGFECVSNLCREIPEEDPECVDEDGDGYGVGDAIEDRAPCEECENFGRCGEDCDDQNAEVFPGAGCP